MDDIQDCVDGYIEALREEAIVSMIAASPEAEEYKARYREAVGNRCITIARARREKAEQTLRALHACCDAMC